MDTDYLKRVAIYIASAIISLGIIVYFGYHIWSSFTPDVKTEPITETTITKTADAEGYIFRREHLLSTSASGTVVPSAAEGEKLGVNAEAAKLYSSGKADAVARIAEIDARLALLRECTDTSTVTLKDASKFDTEIYTVMTEIRRSLDRGDAKTASALRQELISLVSKKSILMGGTVNMDAEIASLEKERSGLVSQLGSCLDTVSTQNVSGYYYSSVDGYEGAFDASILADSDFDTIKKAISSAPASSKGYVGKLVTDSRWYVVCYVDKGVGSMMTEGEMRDVIFTYNGELSLSMRLDRLIRGEDSYVCVFSTDYMPRDFEYTRCQPVKITMSSYTGFKVRISSVRLLGDLRGVYVLDGSTVKFRKISILTEDEGFYIVETSPDGTSEYTTETSEGQTETTEAKDEGYSWLRLHDNIITEGTGLYHGRLLGK